MIEIRDDISEDRLAFSVLQNGISIALFRDVEDARTFIEARSKADLVDFEDSVGIKNVGTKEDADLGI